MKKYLKILLAILCILFLSGYVAASTITVCSFDCDYTSIGANTTINSRGSGTAVFLNNTNDTIVSNFIILNDSATLFVSDWTLIDDSPLPANYSLVLMSIDSKSPPRQAWLRLSNDSGIIDDKVVSAGETFEMGYGIWPNHTTLLNATVESVFSGYSIYAILNHTYLYDDGVAVMSDARLILAIGSDKPVLYTTGGIDYKLKEGYTLTVRDVDAETSPRQLWLRLSKNGDVLEERVISEGNTYSHYKNGSLILSARIDRIFSSGELWAATFSSINQYSEKTHNLLLSEPFYMFKNADVYSKNNWSLHENYNLSMIGIDENAYPKEVWLQLSKNNTIVDNNIIEIGNNYNYSKNGNLVITANVRDIFKGFDNELVILDNTYQYSETTHSLLLSNSSHSYSAGNLKGVNWSLYQGYTLSAVDIDSNIAPITAWLRLSKNGTLLDEKVVSEGGNYTYYSGVRKILSSDIKTIFDGETTGRINITNVYQYDENTGDTLMSNASHVMIFGDVIKGETWYLYEGYAITPMDIEAHISPRRAWLRFTKNNKTVDEDIVAQGENYTYYKNRQLIFTAYLESVFVGALNNMIKFRQVRQYSEINGTSLIEFNASDVKTLTLDKPPPTPIPIIKGDVNSDGEVNIIDAMFISQYTVGLRTDIDTTSADINGDGEVNIIDAMFISQYTVGLRNKI